MNLGGATPSPDQVGCRRLPDSRLCRNDLTTLEETVRAFPAAFDSDFSLSPDLWTPSSWTVDEPTELVLWENLDATDSGVTISGWCGTATVDPNTLAPVAVDGSTSG